MTFGPNNFRLGTQGNAPIGQAQLDYTIDPNTSAITAATFTYINSGPNQAFAVSFTGPVNGVYSGNSIMQPPLNIPGRGSFKSSTFAFNPGSQALSGVMRSSQADAGDTAVDWESDPSVHVPLKQTAVAGSKY